MSLGIPDDFGNRVVPQICCAMQVREMHAVGVSVLGRAATGKIAARPARLFLKAEACELG